MKNNTQNLEVELVEEFQILLGKMPVNRPPSIAELLKVEGDFSKLASRSIKHPFFDDCKDRFDLMQKSLLLEKSLSERAVLSYVMMFMALLNAHPVLLPGLIVVMAPLVNQTINQYKASLN
jgi:hypothetical protein